MGRHAATLTRTTTTTTTEERHEPTHPPHPAPQGQRAIPPPPLMHRRDMARRALAARLAEPSTWASLGGLALAAGWQLPEGAAQGIAQVCGLLGLLVGAVMPERGKT